MSGPHTITESGCVRTAKDVVIGGGYRRPPPSPSADGERIQAALLKSHVVGFRGAMRPSKRRPSLIPLDNSLLARFVRWVRWLRLRGPL